MHLPMGLKSDKCGGWALFDQTGWEASRIANGLGA